MWQGSAIAGKPKPTAEGSGAGDASIVSSRPEATALALDASPELLTIAEAARFLRISRTTAYAEAKRYERTGEGLPVIRVGHSLRAPKAMLQRLVAGELVWAGDK
ncbi:MAG: helix-turn-helix domain-containing protein [Acidimicrobiia bacterium]|nr:helix-turn-helix domain-containing protein [Acidimicrobiia bacterium]